MSDKAVYSAGPDGHKEIPLKQLEPVRLSFQRGHKGSGITLVDRLQMHPAGKEELLTKLKRKFGVGGTLKQGRLELQGDVRGRAEAELKALGYKVRRIGGWTCG